MIERDRIVLPEPDSPTTPSVRPRSRVSETPSTALTVPRSVRKWVRRSSTSRSRADVARWVCVAVGRGDDLLGHSAPSLMSKYSRMRSPARFRDKTVRNITKQGMSDMYG